MKKFHYLLLSAYCLLLLVSASPTLQFQHNETQVGETILATITSQNEFAKQIEQEDITFLDGRKKIFLESDITFYNGTHYLYIYTTREGNFTIKIENILYKENNQLKSLTIEKQFTISRSQNETQILSVKPGFIITTTQPQIKLTNKGTLPLNITYNDKKISLNQNDFQKITFQPTQILSLFEIQTYKTFSIPVIFPTANSSFESPTIQLDLKQDPELLFAELTTNTESKQTIQLFNFGDENITILQTTSGLQFLKIQSPETIQPRKIQNLTITIYPENPGHFQNKINITYSQYNKTQKLQIPVSLFVLPKGSAKKDFEIIEETCVDKNGTVCATKEICDTKAFFTKSNEYCCPGKCEPIKRNPDDKSNYKWIIGLLIIIALGALGYYLYKKQKKLIPEKPEDKIKQSVEKYTKRTKGSLTKS